MEHKGIGFPRILGMCIGKKNYDNIDYLNNIARVHIAILGFYPGWTSASGKTPQQIVDELKSRNPTLRVGQYTILSETPDSQDRTSADSDKGRKLDTENWWLRNALGGRVQWTTEYGAFEANISRWVDADAQGLRYSEWLARRDAKQYFNTIKGLSIWFFDNALDRPAVSLADWNKDGKDDSKFDELIAAEYRAGHAREWAEAKSLCPLVDHMGNATDISSIEYSGKLQGAFLEALMGLSWSLETQSGWTAVMARYRSAMRHTTAPHLVGFSVHGEKTDYRLMRYGLASCLLDDGYFSYTDVREGYGVIPWFDEYDAALGSPLDAPPTTPWSNGVYRRLYKNGMVLVNPENTTATVRIEPGYQRIKGAQDPAVNTGARSTSITLVSKDGILLVKSPNSVKRVFIESLSIAPSPNPQMIRIYFKGLIIIDQEHVNFGGTPERNYSIEVLADTRHSVIRRLAIERLALAFSVRPSDVQFLNF